MIQVGEVSEPLLKLLAVYSPEFPCLLKGAARYAPDPVADLRGQRDQAVHRVRHQPVPRLHAPRPARVRRGRPRPVVPGLPNPPVPIGPIDLDEGVEAYPGQPDPRQPAAGRAADAVAAAVQRLRRHARRTRRSSTRCWPARRGRAADSYGALGSLVYGPVVRGGDDVVTTRGASDKPPEREAGVRQRRRRCAAAARHVTLVGRHQARHLHHRLDPGHRPARRDHGQHRLRRRHRVPGDLHHRLDAARRATTSGSPASASARSRRSSTTSATRRWSPSGSSPTCR